jgi:NAD-dependent deacetylase
MSKQRKTIVALTGAGASAESGIATFRAKDGLWENHPVEEVATPEGWGRDPRLVLRFYNERRRAILAAEPNEGHRALAALEAKFDVRIITQNIDDLHERAGSTRVLHLHGEARKARSTADPDLVLPVEGAELNWGDTCPLGSQLRPHIVWFGEPVPAMEEAAEIAAGADLFLIVGTSLQVYPAAGLMFYAPPGTPKFWIDPEARPLSGVSRLEALQEKSGIALPRLAAAWLAEGW